MGAVGLAAVLLDSACKFASRGPRDASVAHILGILFRPSAFFSDVVHFNRQLT